MQQLSGLMDLVNKIQIQLCFLSSFYNVCHVYENQLNW